MAASGGTAVNPAEAPHALVGVGAGVATMGAVLAAGLANEAPPLALGWVAAFVLLSVEADVRSLRIPNLLTFPMLGGALAAGAWSGGTDGFAEALLGAAVGIGLLLAPYALGVLGAGDVKAVMALGAWLGPSAVFGLVWRSLLLAALAGVVWLAWRRELWSFGQRWLAIALASQAAGRIHYLAPAEGSAARSGMPFAVAVGFGLAWLWGSRGWA